MLSGELADKIRMSYSGGAVDMYLTKPIRNRKIYGYDVNSLYPFVMKNNKFPIGSPTYFEGDILKLDSNAFGFFYCKISAPSYKNYPILQAHIKTQSGIKSIYPTGNWEGMYFSEELYNAKKYGYSFEILWGYTFEKGNIFQEYVDSLYSLRLQYPKSDPMNLICKLLLNSLYGRFGMSDLFTQNYVYSKEDYSKIEERKGFKESLQDVIDLGSNYLVQLKNPLVEQKTNLDNGKEIHNVNIAIASAITAYARIHMSQFKGNSLLPTLYYSDTDSLYFDGPLSDSFIDSLELGKLKLVGVYDDAIFLAPKVYALKNSSEEIIKIKGLSEDSIIKNEINLKVLDSFLIKDSNEQFPQNKMFRHLDKGNIEVLEQNYNIQATNNKRDLIYDEDDILIGSKPFFVVDGKLDK
jgi:hypothetical protein